MLRSSTVTPCFGRNDKRFKIFNAIARFTCLYLSCMPSWLGVVYYCLCAWYRYIQQCNVYARPFTFHMMYCTEVRTSGMLVRLGGGQMELKHKFLLMLLFYRLCGVPSEGWSCSPEIILPCWVALHCTGHCLKVVGGMTELSVYIVVAVNIFQRRKKRAGSICAVGHVE